LPVNVCLPTCEFVFEGWPVRERKRKRERERERERAVDRVCVCTLPPQNLGQFHCVSNFYFLTKLEQQKRN
jgi:hypothetical protein